MTNIAATTGVLLPEWFPVDQYNDINRLVAEATTRDATCWRNFAAAWNAVSYRVRIATDDLGELKRRWSLDLSPPPQDRLEEERLLLSSVSNSIAAFECCCFGLYCVAGAVAPEGFPSDDQSLRNLYPKQVLSALDPLPSARTLREAIAAALSSPIYQQLKEIRDFLSHRGALPRLVRLSNIRPYPSAIPSNPKAPGQDWTFDLDLTVNLLQNWSKWLDATISGLVRHGHAMASSLSTPSPGDTRPSIASDPA